MIAEKFLKEVVTASPGDNLGQIASLMEEHNVGTIVITENQKPMGIVTDRDLALELGARGRTRDMPVSRIMISPIDTIHKNDGIMAITESMRDFKVRRLAVVDDRGRLVGIVTMDDILRTLTREMSNLMEGIVPEMIVD